MRRGNNGRLRGGGGKGILVGIVRCNRFDLSAKQRDVYFRYAGLALPRHTSYPIVPVWKAEGAEHVLRDGLSAAGQGRRPISLYIHLPFCQSLCYYCCCTKEIVSTEQRRRRDPVVELLANLAVESDRTAELIGDCTIRRIHLGGGSPTFLATDQMEALWQILHSRYRVADDVEAAVELDPRGTTRELLVLLKRLGVRRLSLGIQDFDAAVQTAVHRTQPMELVDATMSMCREVGFESVNFDLIYGLPFQTPATMAKTLEETVRLSPDRVAFFRLAVLPEMFRWQNVFRPQDLPSAEMTLEMNLLAVNAFLDAGYEFIGLDHFAKPTEALARARSTGELRRDFQGMTTGGEMDVVGLGPSAISDVAGVYAQKRKTSTEWGQQVQAGLATERGHRRSLDDECRRFVLQSLYGWGRVRKSEFALRFGRDFDAYFQSEVGFLRELERDGLVELHEDRVELTECLGRLLVRVVGSVIDAYLPPNAYREGLSAGLASRVG